MNRIIKDYDPINHNITLEFLYETNDWDLIEINYKIDSDRLVQWFNEFEKDFSQCKFSFNEMSESLNLELSKEMVDKGYCGVYCGPIDGYTLAWPIERYEPLPPPKQCNPKKYPEVNYDTFYNDAKIMSKYRRGYLAELVDTLGEDSFKQLVITSHHPGMYIRQHIDSKILKLHIPIITSEQAFFHFGENKERKYHMKAGHVYILNTGDWHGTTNESDIIRSHMITRIDADSIMKVIELVN